MNMIARKLKAASPVDGDDVLDVLSSRLLALDARNQDLLKLQIEQENTTTTADSDEADVTQAEAMLDGHNFVAARGKPVGQLAAIIAERKTIARALKIGRSRQFVLAAERAGQIWASFYPKIAEMEKRRVFLALELQRTNAERELLREKIVQAGGSGGFLPTDGVELLYLANLHDEVVWASERLIADGITTRAEIEKAKII